MVRRDARRDTSRDLNFKNAGIYIHASVKLLPSPKFGRISDVCASCDALAKRSHARDAISSGNARGRLRARSAVPFPHRRRPRSVAARRIIVPHSRRIGHSHAIDGRNPRDCLHVCASRAFFYSDHRPRPTRRAVRTSRYITERSGGTRPTIIGLRHASFSPLPSPPLGAFSRSDEPLPRSSRAAALIATFHDRVSEQRHEGIRKNRIDPRNVPSSPRGDLALARPDRRYAYARKTPSAEFYNGITPLVSLRAAGDGAFRRVPQACRRSVEIRRCRF